MIRILLSIPLNWWRFQAPVTVGVPGFAYLSDQIVDVANGTRGSAIAQPTDRGLIPVISTTSATAETSDRILFPSSKSDA